MTDKSCLCKSYLGVTVGGRHSNDGASNGMRLEDGGIVLAPHKHWRLLIPQHVHNEDPCRH